MLEQQQKKSLTPRQKVLHEIIFEADTLAGKIFDLVLICCIIGSVTVVMLDSIKSIREGYGQLLGGLDLFFTILFTIEYFFRLYAVASPKAYAGSFYGVIDIMAIIPGYLGLIFPGTQYLSVVRIFRVLRVFRILKLAHYLQESDTLWQALVASRKRITVFVMGVMTLVVIIGSAMYVIEGEENGFTSIPVSIYWAVVTLTTVGYGDISPKTPLGQAFSVFIMILGYGIIAIPTGIVTAEMAMARKEISTQSCPVCAAEGHDVDAAFCKSCGNKLN